MAATLLSPLNVHSQVATPSTTGVNGVVFYTGTDQDIHEMYWVGNSYVDANLMASSGSGMQVSPGTTPNPDTHGSVWYVAADQCVHWMAFDGTKWLDANLMASSGSAMRVAAGTNVSTNNNNYIYYVGTDQDIHQLFWGGTQYLDADLMTSSGSGMQVAPGTSPTADTLGDVWYVGTDQCVHWMAYNGTQWLDANWMTSSESGMQVAPGTSLATNNNTLIYYIGTDHDVHELFWGGSNYLDANLMASSGSGMQVLPNTSPIADTLGDIWYTGTDQDVHWMAYNGTKWLDANWMTSSGSGEYVALNTNLSATSNGILLYVGADQDVHEMYWGGNHYLDANLMASTGSGMTASIPRTVTVQNLTNPSWGANFNVGDTFSVTIQGPGNLPVVLSQSPGSTTQAGYTSATGTFTMTATENTGNIGSYTQVWSVGSLAASPSISYLVGQLGNPGTISTTEEVDDGDGSLTGISTLSIDNGVVSTYSATELSPAAMLYYDAGAVATLFNDAGQVAQGVTGLVNGTAFTTLSATANAWDDYSLQTDHSVYAFEISGVYYNPLYFAEGSCDDDSEDGSDCSLAGDGTGPYQLEFSRQYLGSTLAFQTDVPQDGSLALLGDSAYDSFFQSAQQPVQDPPALISWKVAVSTIAPVLFAARSAWAHDNPTNPYQYRLPYMLVLVNDSENPPPSGNNNNQRIRRYLLEDTYGEPWPFIANYPVNISEKFTYIGGSLASLPEPNNPSTGGTPWTSPGDISHSAFEDMYGFRRSGTPPVSYLQFYWAWAFSTPVGFTLPTVPGVNDGSLTGMNGNAVPLMIKSKNVNTNFQNCAMYGAQGVYMTQQYIWINGQAAPSSTNSGCPTQLGVF